MTKAVEISDSKSKSIKRVHQIEPTHKKKGSENTCVNINIRSIQIHAPETARVIEKLRRSIYSLIVFLVVAFTAGILYAHFAHT